MGDLLGCSPNFLFLKIINRGGNITMRIGSGFISSNGIETSVANRELIPTPPSNWTIPYNVYKFSFINDTNCTCVINGSHTIFLRAGQGFSTSEVDAVITSFRIVEAGVKYNFVGAY